VSSSIPRIFLSAGEASGDHYGAALVGALKADLPDAEFFGLGGREMQQAGQHRVVRAEDVAHMGITEVIRHAPYIYAQFRKLVKSIEARRPDIAVLIDFPDVNFRLAKALKKRGIPVIYLVSPQLWAWKRGRLRWVQQRVTKMLVIFPFEADFYRNRGVDAEFIGHPLAALALPSISREAYAEHYKLDSEKPWIALLPGSRWTEITANLPAMVEMASRIPFPCEYILPVASTIDRVRLKEFIKGWITFRPTVSSLPLPYIHLVPDAREALYHARVSIVASGTATVQAAVIGNPFVVVYRVSAVTFALAKRLVRYPLEIFDPEFKELDDDGNLPIAMVNLIAGRRIVPELLQERFSAVNLVEAITPLMADSPQRERMMEDLAEVRGRLLVRDTETESAADPIGRAVVIIRDVLFRAVPDKPQPGLLPPTHSSQRAR
jgi:lipid-A-disaccharide synthase